MKRRGGVLVSLLGFLALAALVFGIIGYSMGWLEFSDDSHQTTIEIDKQRAQETAKDAADATENAIREAGDALNRAGKELMDDDEDPDVDVDIDTKPDADSDQ